MERKQHLSLMIHILRSDGEETNEEREEVQGTIYHKGDVVYLTYREKQEEGVVHNTLKLETNQVTVIRHGAVSMNHRFQRGETTRGLLRTSLGHFKLETHTLRYRLAEESVRWTYRLKVGGQDIGEVRFHIGWQRLTAKG